MPRPKNGSEGPAKPRRPSAKPPNGHDAHISSDDVARRAYELYQSRGGRNGSDFDDWIQAEAQLKQIAQTQPPPAVERRKRTRAVSA